MRIDFNKLRAAGFDVQEMKNGVEINYVLTDPSSKLNEILSSYAVTPMGKDLILGTVYDAIAKAKFLEAIG